MTKHQCPTCHRIADEGGYGSFINGEWKPLECQWCDGGQAPIPMTVDVHEGQLVPDMKRNQSHE